MTISLRLSGGAANADPLLSLGGAMSSVAVPTKLFPKLTPANRTAGVTWYSCVYAYSDATASSIRAWISSETPSLQTSIAVGWGALKNATQTSTANKETAPSGVTFSTAASHAAAPVGNDYVTGDYRALWIRYTVAAGTSVIPLDQFRIMVNGDVTVPVNTALPTITGTLREGQTITFNTGTWSGTPDSYTRTLYENYGGGTIVGATLLLTALHVGKVLHIAVTASNAGGTSAPAFSAVTAAVQPMVPVNSAAPAVTGSTVQGGVLTTTDGTWSGSPTSYGHIWQESTSGSWSTISGQTGSTFTTTSTQVGKPIRSGVQATNAGGTSDYAFSAATAAITAQTGDASLRSQTSSMSGATNGTSHAMALPATVVAGDRLLVLFVFDGDPGHTWDNTSHGLWTQLFSQENNYTVNFAAYWKVAAGTESNGTLTITTSTPQLSSHQSFCVQNAAAVQAAASNFASNISCDPPNLTPTWGTGKSTFWIASVGYDNGSRVPTNQPGGYSNYQLTLRSDAADGCGLVSVSKLLTAASENPGAFSLDYEAWHCAATIGVESGVQVQPGANESVVMMSTSKSMPLSFVGTAPWTTPWEVNAIGPPAGSYGIARYTAYGGFGATHDNNSTELSFLRDASLGASYTKFHQWADYHIARGADLIFQVYTNVFGSATTLTQAQWDQVKADIQTWLTQNNGKCKYVVLANEPLFTGAPGDNPGEATSAGWPSRSAPLYAQYCRIVKQIINASAWVGQIKVIGPEIMSLDSFRRSIAIYVLDTSAAGPNVGYGDGAGTTMKNWVDIVSCHGYHYTGGNFNPVDGGYSLMQSYISELAAIGWTGPIWETEFMWTANKLLADGVTNMKDGTWATIVEQMARRFAAGFASGFGHHCNFEWGSSEANSFFNNNTTQGVAARTWWAAFITWWRAQPIGRVVLLTDNKIRVTRVDGAALLLPDNLLDGTLAPNP